jgi:hypothetical protein
MGLKEGCLTIIEITYFCDGKKTLGRAYDSMHCHHVTSADPVNDTPEGRKSAWRMIRARGWHEAAWRGKARHLCPECWADFIARNK